MTPPAGRGSIKTEGKYDAERDLPRHAGPQERHPRDFHVRKTARRRDRLRERVRLLAGQPQRALPGQVHRRHAGPCWPRKSLSPCTATAPVRATRASAPTWRPIWQRPSACPMSRRTFSPPPVRPGAIAHAIRAVTKPGDEVLTFRALLPGVRPLCGGHRRCAQGRAAAGTGVPAESRRL